MQFILDRDRQDARDEDRIERNLCILPIHVGNPCLLVKRLVFVPQVRISIKLLTSGDYGYILLFMNEKLDPSLLARYVEVTACANRNLRMAARAVTQYYAQIMAPSGLEPTQFTLLVGCALAGPVPLTDLADILVMDRTTLARNLRILQKHRLVSVEEGEDRRIRTVRLTAEGVRKIEQALPLWRQAQEHVVEGLGQDRFSRLLEDLSEVVDVVREADA
jgi:DNA-binding MarR family transcriptional regulator